MTTRKVNHTTEVLPGQWICIEPLLRDHICNPPREVLRRRGKRIYYAGREGAEKFCALSSVVALCDTQAEADAFFAISQSQFDELNAVREKRQAEAEAMFIGLVA